MSVGVGAALLALSGCTGLVQPIDPASSSAPSATEAPGSASSDPAARPSDQPSGQPSDQPSDQPSAVGDDLGTVAATRTIKLTTTVYSEDAPYANHASPATIRVYELKRQGPVVQLSFAISLDSRAIGDWDSSNDMTDSDSNFTTTDISGVKLIDGTNARVYSTGSDADGDCLCSGRIFLTPGVTVMATAAFAAPPTDAVTVTVPFFGSFSDVPIV